jgi:hypothetical protein
MPVRPDVFLALLLCGEKDTPQIESGLPGVDFPQPVV